MIQYGNSLSYNKATRIVGKLSLPLIAARLVSALNGFGGMLMLAQLGSQALAAGALITAAFNTLMVLVWGMMFSVGVLVGHSHGADKSKHIGQTIQASILLSILISIPAAILMWHVPPIFLLLHQPRAEVLLARQYFHPASLMVLPSLICVCFSQFCMGIGRVRLVLVWSLLTLPMSLILAYGLLFGRWGLPHLGIAGIAWANVIVWTGLFIVLAIYFIYHKSFKQYDLLRWDFKVFPALMLRMVKLGTPISFQFGGELAAFAVMILLMGLFGSDALAAQQIVIQIALLVVMIPLGISQAAAILISQALGAKKHFALKRLGYSAVGIGLAAMLVIALLYWFFPHLLINLYMRGIHANAAVRHLAVLLFSVMAISQVLDSARNILTGALRGLHDTHQPMKIGMLAVWCIALPAGFVLAFPCHLGPIGLPLGFVLGFLLGDWLLLRRFQRLLRQFQAQF